MTVFTVTCPMLDGQMEISFSQMHILTVLMLLNHQNRLCVYKGT